jgi:hypothetical protein
LIFKAPTLNLTCLKTTRAMYMRISKEMPLWKAVKCMGTRSVEGCRHTAQHQNLMQSVKT